MRILTQEEYKKKYGKNAKLARTSKQKPGFVERTKEAAGQGISKIKAGFEQAGTPRGPLQGFEAALKLGAGAVETAFSPLTAAVEPIIKPTLGRGVEKLANKISDIPAVQKFATSKAGEATSRAAEDVLNLSEISGAIVGSKTAIKTPISKVGSAIDRGIDKTLQPIKAATEKLQSTAGPMIQEARRIPSRIATNVAEKQAIQETINKLPTRVAREAAQDGLDIGDIKTIYSIAKEQKAPLKKLATVVKDFSEGKTKVNPIEVVGKPIVNRLKQLETARIKIGSKLGAVAKDLGTVTPKETFYSVYNRLKEVPGLQELQVNNKGILDFRNTVLATAETSSDRAAIQRIFTAALKKGSGEQKHLLRQELFEALGGKKRANLNLTATQEKAYEAIRRGLSDFLESKNPTYKKLSAEYRRVVTPIHEMRKIMRVVGQEYTDVMEMSAGLLARRLTSLAQSNPQIRAILNAMDKATKLPGKTRISVEALQDFYNILEKYYDIAPKTGFQAQVRQGVEKAAGGPLHYIGEQIKSFAGETPIVRQRALERILEEIFK